jgi:diaminopimelate epimerase
VAAAIALDLEGKSSGPCQVILETPGGSLEVRFERNNGSYTDIWLTGPAAFVFEGSIKIPYDL